MRFSLKKTFAFITRYQRILSTVSTVVGFVMHVVIINAIDLALTEFILAGHLLIVSGATLIGALPSAGERANSFFARARSLMPLIYQYSTGALLSSFLILYAASGSLTASLPFLVLLAVAAIGNEALRLERGLLPFQTTLLALNGLLYAALIIPILLHEISIQAFLTAVTLTAMLFALFVAVLWFLARRSVGASLSRVVTSAVSTFGLVMILYFGNVMPPIPLAVKDDGFYHEVAKVGNQYRVLDEPGSASFFDLGGRVLYLGLGERAYFYSAIFAPATLGTDIVHRWQHYDPTGKTWSTVEVVTFPITGGRDAGYRGYSFINTPEPGQYRVSVETAQGQILGHYPLTIVRTPATVTTEVRMLK